MNNRNMMSAYWALRVTLGAVAVVAGADKFTNLLANWEGYLSPIAVRVLPISPAAFMHIAGLVEIAVGLGILVGRARIFGFVACAWLAAIAVNLVTTGHFLDVAARDVVMAVAGFALGQLARSMEHATVEQPQLAGREAHAHA